MFSNIGGAIWRGNINVGLGQFLWVKIGGNRLETHMDVALVDFVAFDFVDRTVYVYTSM